MSQASAQELQDEKRLTVDEKWGIACHSHDMSSVLARAHWGARVRVPGIGVCTFCTIFIDVDVRYGQHGRSELEAHNKPHVVVTLPEGATREAWTNVTDTLVGHISDELLRAVRERDGRDARQQDACEHGECDAHADATALQVQVGSLPLRQRLACVARAYNAMGEVLPML
jgi:hypothetical protein